jgi:hypothetical protein
LPSPLVVNAQINLMLGEGKYCIDNLYYSKSFKYDYSINNYSVQLQMNQLFLCDNTCVDLLTLIDSLVDHNCHIQYSHHVNDQAFRERVPKILPLFKGTSLAVSGVALSRDFTAVLDPDLFSSYSLRCLPQQHTRRPLPSECLASSARSTPSRLHLGNQPNQGCKTQLLPVHKVVTRSTRRTCPASTFLLLQVPFFLT